MTTTTTPARIRAVHMSGVLDACGRTGASPAVTADPADVTCKRCRSILRYRAQERHRFFRAAEWTVLRDHITRERAAQDQLAADHGELGHRDQEERAYGRVEALDELLATMERLEAD